MTAYGNLVQGPDRVENLELSGTGYQVIRIQDFAPFDDMVLPQIDLIDIGPVSAPEGLYGITSDICGNKYVAGLNYRSNRIHKIDCFGNVNPAGSSFPIEFGRGCNYPFPFSHPPSRHPTGVSMDGRGMLWVQYKNWPKVTRIDPADPATIVDFDCPVYGRPVNIGDFTGYWTAAGLFPLDISDGNRDMSGRTNIEKLRSGENPFFELALPNRQGGSAGCSLSPSTVGPPP